MAFRPTADQIKQPDRPKLADTMGPGLITGASDDDPSGNSHIRKPAHSSGTPWVGHSCSPTRSCAQSK
jgi:hypothetical protein